MLYALANTQTVPIHWIVPNNEQVSKGMILSPDPGFEFNLFASHGSAKPTSL